MLVTVPGSASARSKLRGSALLSIALAGGTVICSSTSVTRTPDSSWYTIVLEVGLVLAAETSFALGIMGVSGAALCFALPPAAMTCATRFSVGASDGATCAVSLPRISAPGIESFPRRRSAIELGARATAPAGEAGGGAGDGAGAAMLNRSAASALLPAAFADGRADWVHRGRGSAIGDLIARRRLRGRARDRLGRALLHRCNCRCGRGGRRGLCDRGHGAVSQHDDGDERCGDCSRERRARDPAATPAPVARGGDRSHGLDRRDRRTGHYTGGYVVERTEYPARRRDRPRASAARPRIRRIEQCAILPARVSSLERSSSQRVMSAFIDVSVSYRDHALSFSRVRRSATLRMLQRVCAVPSTAWCQRTDRESQRLGDLVVIQSFFANEQRHSVALGERIHRLARHRHLERLSVPEYRLHDVVAVSSRSRVRCLLRRASRRASSRTRLFATVNNHARSLSSTSGAARERTSPALPPRPNRDRPACA